MSRLVAFLRGVNLGRRTVKSADLVAAFTALGFGEVTALLASGNVAFTAAAAPDLAARIEAALEQKFGFPIGTVLRTRAELVAIVASSPFGALSEGPDLKLYVTLLAEPEARRLTLPCAIPGDFEVVKVTDREIFHVAHRQPNGRYGAGASLIGKPFGKKILWTNRNWNTIVKAATA